MKAHRKVLSILVMALAVALAFVIVPAITDSGGQASAEQPLTLIYYDAHMHTTRSDGTGEVSDIKATAQARGLSTVIITDHCTSLTQAEWASLVADTAAASDGSFLALPGVEITGSEGIFNRGHMNAYNIDDPFVGDDEDELCPSEVWPDPPNPWGTGPMYPENLTKWVDYIHSQGGIVNHNHTTGSTQLEYGVNNVEIYNQGHVDDIAANAVALGIDPYQAWEFAITINNFAIYGERDLNMEVDFLGNLMPLRVAIYVSTQYIPPYIGQIFGWNPPDPPNPLVPGDLNSWDELLMAYVDGTVDTPMFGVANNLRWLGSGPRCGLGEIRLPDLQPGSSIMPGKVNPVLCEAMMQVCARVIGNDQTMAVCGAAGGQFQLNTMMPLMADVVLESIRLLARATAAFCDRCLSGMEANPQACEAAVEQSLSLATGLNPYIGYEQAAALAKEAFASGKTIRQLCIEKQIMPEDQLDEALDPWRMTRPE